MNQSMFEISRLRELIWPVVIRPTRFDGKFEGESWVAFPQCWASINDEFPGAVDKNADVCAAWWADPENVKQVGVGENPNLALANLIIKKVPGAELGLEEIDECFDEDAIHDEAETARRDAISLITCYNESVMSGNFEGSANLEASIVSEWEEHEDVSPLLGVLVAFSYRFLREAAVARGMEPEAYLTQVALAMENNAEDQ